MRQSLTPRGPILSRLACGLWRLADWNISTEESTRFVEAVLDTGITTFDLADLYGDFQSEPLFGQVLKAQPGLRSQMEIITKCGIRPVSDRRPENRIKHYDTRREHIIASVENSLQTIQTDHIDLLLIHRPDPLMDASEVAATFAELKKQGKVLHFGVSNFTTGQFDLLNSRMESSLVTNQVQVSPLHLEAFEDGTLDQCQRLELSPMAWSPFHQGGLFSLESDKAIRVRAALDRIAQEREVGFDQVVLAWLMKHPSRMIPVLGSGKIERIKSATGSLSIELNHQEWFEIWTASTGNDVP